MPAQVCEPLVEGTAVRGTEYAVCFHQATPSNLPSIDLSLQQIHVNWVQALALHFGFQRWVLQRLERYLDKEGSSSGPLLRISTVSGGRNLVRFPGQLQQRG